MVKKGFKAYFKMIEEMPLPTKMDEAYIFNLMEWESEKTAIPASVYRIQLNHAFTFKDAIKCVPYWKELGVDAIYCSPYLKAKPGSMHGYDVASPWELNPEIGTREDYEEFCKALQEAEIGHILDLVSNHMAASLDNMWWRDIMENGPSSIYTEFFDIDWFPPRKDLALKVYLPLLEETLEEAIGNQRLELFFQDGEFRLHINGLLLPINPETYPDLLEHSPQWLEGQMALDYRGYLEFEALLDLFRDLKGLDIWSDKDRYYRHLIVEKVKSRLKIMHENSPKIREFFQMAIEKADLKALLEKQFYHLAYWREGPAFINYRRFFDINDLVALKVENESVFKQYHSFVYELMLHGNVQGLRIDHPDGLYEPTTFFQRLQHFYIYYKVLMIFKEHFPSEEIDLWMVGQAVWKKVSMPSSPFYTVVEKILEAYEHLPKGWNVHGTVGYEYMDQLTNLFINPQAEGAFQTIYCDFLGEKPDRERILYEEKRIYATEYLLSEIEALTKRLHAAVQRLETKHYDYEDLKLGIVELFAAFPVYRTYIEFHDEEILEGDLEAIQTAFAKIKKLSNPPKKEIINLLENIYLLKRGAKEYRDFVLRFQQLSPPIMAKGYEDTHLYVNLRFVAMNDVGSQIAHFGLSQKDFHRRMQRRLEKWPFGLLPFSTHDSKRSGDVRMRLAALSAFPDRWAKLVKEWKKINEPLQFPDANFEYFIYQTLLGMMPLEGDESVEHRLIDYLIKAAREAKVHTNWVHHNVEYEEALTRCIKALVARKQSPDFWKSFGPFLEEIDALGKKNSLAALMVRLASPGVFDLYRGDEIWNYSLVDPDNRRPVDFSALRGTLQHLEGEPKLKMLQKGLQLRRLYPDLFLDGSYLPLDAPEEILAFMREANGQVCLIAIHRFSQESSIELKIPREVKKLRDLFTGKSYEIKERQLKIELPAFLTNLELP